MKRPGALTAGLRSLGRFDLRVGREYAEGARAVEALALECPVGTPVWVREVVMSVDGIDCVSARSITPLAASHGVWSGIRRLNTRPLADMLYGDSDIRRSLFEWCQLGFADPFWKAARLNTKKLTPPATRPTERTKSAPQLLARRSVFWRRGQPLLVAECFLPEFWKIAQLPR